MNKRVLILASFSISTLTFAQDISVIRNVSNIYDSNSNIGTARYMAMAGSMGALGGDLSALNNNPAGLGVFITNDASASLSINSAQTSSSLAGQSVRKTIDHTGLGHIGGLISLQTEGSSPWKFINIGVSYTTENIDRIIQSPANHNIAEPYRDNNNVIKDYNLYSGHKYEVFGNRSRLNIGIGGNYDNKIYVGAAINFSSVDVEQMDRTLITSKNNLNRSWEFNKQGTPFRENGGGFSISMGIIGKISNEIRIGAAFETPTWYNVERDYVEYSRSNNTNYISSISYVENRNLRTPSKLTLSGAFIPNKSFAFNVDYRIELGKPNFSRGSVAEDQLNDFYQSTYKARNEVRIGGEYRLENFRVRGGYTFATSPFKNYTYSVRYNDDGSISANEKVSNYIVGNSQTFSGGIGYDFKSFYIDASYRYLIQDSSNPFFDGIYVLSGSDGAYFNQNVSIISDVKTKKNNFVLTLGWKF